MTVIDADALAELEEERRFLLSSISDLDREHAAGDIDDADYQALLDGYTARAADVLRAIERGRAALPPRPPRRWGRIALGWGAAAVLAVGAGVLVARASGDRGASDEATGGITDSVASTLSRARQLERDDPVGAIELYDAVLAQDPDNAEALTYLGWLEVRTGAQTGAADLVEAGEANLSRAIEVAPDYADPWCFTAIVRFRVHDDAAGAKAAIEQCTAANPPQAVAALLAGLEAEIDAALASGSGGGSLSPSP
jgi:tetratricopeptide (TPR) repeat protein